MATFDDFADTFGSSPAAKDSSAAPSFGEYGMFGTNGVDHDDNIFATEQAQVYETSLPAPQYEAFDAPAATTYEPMTLSEETEDPRMAWYRKNSEVLAKKDQEERELKKQNLQIAQEHLNKIYEARKVSLEAKRSQNREAEKETSGSLPTGNSPWERVTSVINFNFDAHKQDVSRYKNIIITCRTNNVPVRDGRPKEEEPVPVAEAVLV